MKIFYNLNNINFSKPVVTVGTFDGIHKGHVKVVDKLTENARLHKTESVVFTFWPHPRLVLNSEKILLLNSLDEKIERFKQLGIDNLIIYPFTKELSTLNSNDFIKNIIVEKLNTSILIIGYDHRYGNRRKGGFENLKELSFKYNFEIKRIDALKQKDINISSTKIRQAVLEGNLQLAKQYLGYNYMFEGIVTEGKKIGNKIGFPTANIHLVEKFKLIPKQGVFAVTIEFDNKHYKGMMNIGYNPTVSENRNKKIEVNIFDFNDTIYNKKLKITLKHKLRDEIKFDNINKLKNQLQTDKIQAVRLLSVS